MDKRFDWFSVLEYSELEVWVDRLANRANNAYTKDEKSTRGVSNNKRIESFREIARHIISALYSAANSCSKEELWVSLPSTKSAYVVPKTDKGVDTSKIPYSFRYFDSVKDALLQTGWVKETPHITNVKQLTVYPTGDLLIAIRSMGIVWMKVQPKPKELLVELRDVKRDQTTGKPLRNKRLKTTKVDMLVPCTEAVINYRDRLFGYNRSTTQHCISLSCTDDQLISLAEAMASNKQDQKYIDYTSVQLTRIFSRGSMDKGGRFYRGWWQNVPQKYRKYILINGEPTVECDYSGMSLRQLYARANVVLSADQDPYDLGFCDWKGKTDERRSVIKKFVNALLNDEDGIYHLKAEQSKALGGISHEELLKLLNERHPTIVDQLTEGVGLSVQAEDSSIADVVLWQCEKNGIVALPIHDSFIVAKQHRDQLLSIMSQAFTAQYGYFEDIGIDFDEGGAQLPIGDSMMGKYLASWKNRG